MNFASPGISAVPYLLDFYAAMPTYIARAMRLRRYFTVNESVKERTDNDFDTCTCRMATLTDDGEDMFGALVRLAQVPNAVPGLPGASPKEQVAAMLNWLSVSSPGSLPDAFVYNPVTYDTSTPWELLADNGVVPFVKAQFTDTNVVDVNSTIDAVKAALVQQAQNK